MSVPFWNSILSKPRSISFNGILEQKNGQLVLIKIQTNYLQNIQIWVAYTMTCLGLQHLRKEYNNNQNLPKVLEILLKM